MHPKNREHNPNSLLSTLCLLTHTPNSQFSMSTKHKISTPSPSHPEPRDTDQKISGIDESSDPCSPALTHFLRECASGQRQPRIRKTHRPPSPDHPAWSFRKTEAPDPRVRSSNPHFACHEPDLIINKVSYLVSRISNFVI